MKRVISLLVALIIVFATAASVSAIDYGCTVDPVCDAVYLEELNSSTVVYEHNCDEIVYPASTTKIMTYIVVTENISDIDGTTVLITEEALYDLDPESSVMGLEYHIGESFSVRDLLYGLMLPSGNDAALVLANYVGNSVSGFVDLMNRKAAQLGCDNTHFTSPHGLHDSQHYTTARDLAKMTKYAMQKPSFMEICNTVSYLPDGFYESIRTTNYLIDSEGHGGDYYYPYAKGIKTGYTDEAGRCLVSTAEKDGYTYLCVALGADYSFALDINYAMLDTADLYDWAFDNIYTQTVYDSTDTLQTIPVQYVWGNKRIGLVPENAVTALLPAGYDSSLVTTKIECTDTAAAPVSQGDVFGTLTVYYDDTVIGTTNIVAAESAERHITNYILHRAIGAIRHHTLLFIVLLVIMILIIVIAVDRRRRRRALRARRRAR